MKIWLACFGVLFAVAELYQWVAHLTFPLPIHILSGAFLVLASNYNKRAIWPWREPNTDSEPLIGSANHLPGWGSLTPEPPPQSISFTISRLSESKD